MPLFAEPVKLAVYSSRRLSRVLFQLLIGCVDTKLVQPAA